MIKSTNPLTAADLRKAIELLMRARADRVVVQLSRDSGRVVQPIRAVLSEKGLIIEVDL